MIIDSQTNFVYFSQKITEKYQTELDRIITILNNHNVEHVLLKGTNDIWARDYMPIQISDNKYIEYRYDPDYLQGSEKGYRNLKTYPDIVCDLMKLNTIKSDIILDGGNMVKASNCIILTDKIVWENRIHYSKSDLTNKLKDTFEVEKIVFIPWDKKERYGHADGMLRFINNDTVLISDTYKHDKTLSNHLKKGKLNLEWLDFKVKKKDKSSWAYINFLQTHDIILLPKLNADEDYQALEQIEKYYPKYKNSIYQVELTEIIKLGGALNCISWTIKK